MSIQKPYLVLVHGLYMNRLAMKPLEKIYRQHGFEIVIFTYPSMLKNVQQHGAKLVHFLSKLNQNCVVIAHSLGGLVAQSALAQEKKLSITHLIALGVPFQGAQVVKKLYQLKMQKIIGNVAEDLLPHTPSTWEYATKLGIIAGNKPSGLGRLFLDQDLPSDGTVLCSESVIAGYTDYIQLPVSHIGMLFSTEVASQVLFFMMNDRFDHSVIEN